MCNRDSSLISTKMKIMEFYLLQLWNTESLTFISLIYSPFSPRSFVVVLFYISFEIADIIFIKATRFGVSFTRYFSNVSSITNQWASIFCNNFGNNKKNQRPLEFTSFVILIKIIFIIIFIIQDCLIILSTLNISINFRDMKQLVNIYKKIHF